MIYLNQNVNSHQVVKTALKELIYLYNIKKKRKNDKTKSNLFKTSQKN